MRCALPLLPLLLLAACGSAAVDSSYPMLLPLDQLLAEPALPPHAAADPDEVARDLRAAGAGVEAAASAVRAAPITDDALASRAEALSNRAGEIRDTEVIDPAVLARMRAAQARAP